MQKLVPSSFRILISNVFTLHTYYNTDILFDKPFNKKRPSSYLPGPLIIKLSVLRLMKGVYHASKASAGNS